MSLRERQRISKSKSPFTKTLFFSLIPWYRTLLADKPDIIVATPSRALALLQSKVRIPAPADLPLCNTRWRRQSHCRYLIVSSLTRLTSFFPMGTTQMFARSSPAHTFPSFSSPSS